MRSEKLAAEVDLTLNSLDNIQAATSPQYLYSRVIQKIDSRANTWDRLTFHISRSSMAIAIIAIVVITNAAVIMQKDASKPFLTNQPTPSIYLEESTLAAEFYQYELQDENQ